MIDYFHLNMDAEQLLNLSSLGLAHLGDGVYELMVRSWLCLHGKATARNLHRATVGYVAAPAQAAAGRAHPPPAHPGGGGCLPPGPKHRPPLCPQGGQPWGVSDCHRPGGPVRLALSPGPDRPAQRSSSATMMEGEL